MTQPADAKPDVRELMDRLNALYVDDKRFTLFEPEMWRSWHALRRHIEQMEAELAELRTRKWPDDLESGFTYAMEVCVSATR